MGWTFESSKGGGKEGDWAHVPQVHEEVHPPVQTEGGHPHGEPGVYPGSLPPHKYTNIKILNKMLLHNFMPDERVEADNGYAKHADKIKSAPTTM